MPAAAVIPAPIAYINVAAVKKLVVGFLAMRVRPWYFFIEMPLCWIPLVILLGNICCPHGLRMRSRSFTLKKLECLRQAFAMNTLAWNNNLGLRFYFVGF